MSQHLCTWDDSASWDDSQIWVDLCSSCNTNSIIEKGSDYNTDLCKKAEMITPPIIHGDVPLAYIRSLLIGGFEEFRNEIFGTSRDKNVYQSKREPSKIVLEDTLRTEYNNNGIFIENVVANGQGVKFYNQSENEPGVKFWNQSEGIGVKFWNQSESIVTGGVNYIVYIPNAISDKLEAVRSSAEIYRVEGMNFNVLTY